MNKFKFTSARRGGLECGASGAKMVLLSGRGPALQVDQVFIEDYLFETRSKSKARPPLELIRRLLMHKNLNGCQLSFTANEAVKSCFAILPKMNKSEMEGALLLQARKLLSWDGPQPLMAYTSAEYIGNHTGSLVALADPGSIKPWLRFIEGSGAAVNYLTIEACAYQALALRQGWEREAPVFLVADMGAESTLIYVFDHSRPAFMRKVPVGGDAVTKMLTTEVSTASGPIRLTDIEAEEMKISGSVPQAGKNAASGNVALPTREHMETLARPAIERLASEIARSIQYYRDNAGQQVGAVYITGGTASLPALKSSLETSLALPIKLIEPFAGMNFADDGARRYAEKNKARLALAVGLALVDQPAFSLMPHSMKIMKRAAAFMPRAVAALLLLGFLPFAAGGTCQAVKIQVLRSTINQCRIQARQAGEEQRLLETLQRQFQEASDRYTALQQLVGRSPLWPGIFNTLAETIPRNVVLTRVTAHLAPQQAEFVVLHGNVLPSAAGFDDALAAFLSALSASPFFKQVNIISAQAGRTDSALGSFEIQCELIY
jgi:type IV pilus assembly protein PilM